jgi:cobalt/nickel transport system permease protein
MIHLLIAVHIADSVLRWPWLAAGFAVSAVLLAWSSRRIAEEEIPRIALLTAVFFVGSSIHMRVGPSSVHLLLNGLAGVILGRRAVLAIAVGLVLQALLLSHGGESALGVNICIIGIPALLSRPLFCYLMNADQHPTFRIRDGSLAVAWILSPLLSLGLGVVCFGFARTVRNQGAFFRSGFAVGAASVLLTALLNSLTLVVAGTEDWRIIAVLTLIPHIPIALIEGFIVGCTVRFLQRVKPEMLGLDAR